ncbi:MAG: chemotaxis protein CheV [Pseudomonadota bacterium]|nr:chemotaxis protein CheV [Pseudomonadota bacterium]
MATRLQSVDERTRLAGSNRLELLLFHLGGRQRFGINVFKVQEVVHCPPLNSMPKTHPHISGVAHFRGRTIPFIRLSEAIGARTDPFQDGEIFAIITEYNRKVQGFLVSSVDRIVNINWRDIHPPPRGSGHQHYLTAVTEIEDELIEILDVEKVLFDLEGKPESEWTPDLTSDGCASTPCQREVLVVDDSSVARAQICRTLDRVDVKHSVARNGDEAWKLLKNLAEEGTRPSDRFFLVISDIEMPEMDGYTLTKSIRADKRMDDLHVLLHTSLSGSFNKAMVERVGANSFIAKFDAEELGRYVIDVMPRDH